MMRTRERFFIILISICVLQLEYYWPLMPERMASHFYGAGNPNGWSSRSAFFCLYAGLTVMFIFMFRILPSLLRRFPASFMSVPNREYWLASERRQETFSLISNHLLLFGNGTLIFLLRYSNSSSKLTSKTCFACLQRRCGVW